MVCRTTSLTRVATNRHATRLRHHSRLTLEVCRPATHQASTAMRWRVLQTAARGQNPAVSEAWLHETITTITPHSQHLAGLDAHSINTRDIAFCITLFFCFFLQWGVDYLCIYERNWYDIHAHTVFIRKSGKQTRQIGKSEGDNRTGLGWRLYGKRVC